MLFASQNTLRFRYRCHMDRRKQISLFIDSNLLSKANCDQPVPYKNLMRKTEAPLLVNLIQGSKLIKASFGEGLGQSPDASEELCDPNVRERPWDIREKSPAPSGEPTGCSCVCACILRPISPLRASPLSRIHNGAGKCGPITNDLKFVYVWL